VRLNIPLMFTLSKLFAAFSPSVGPAKTFHPSATCPECGSKLFADAGTTNWQCPNLDCPAQIRTRLRHWCSSCAMDITDDPAVVDALVQHGLARDVSELYRLKPAELKGLPGMTADAAKTFFDRLAASRNRDAWRLLFGLSIPLMTESDARALCRDFGSVDNLFAASAERILKTTSVPEPIARNIAQWHSDPVNRRQVKRLFKAGLNFKHR
jgi:DNA ligase (NAD+)